MSALESTDFKGARGSNALPKPALLSVEDAKALDVGQMAELFKEHINPGQFHFMKLLASTR